jgi:hypothetical protein
LRANYRDYGTIEGRLRTIQEGYQGSLQFQLLDAALRQKVRCYFPEDLLPDVFDKFRKRVEVSGIIHYRKNGAPIGIEAERIEALPACAARCKHRRRRDRDKWGSHFESSVIKRGCCQNLSAICGKLSKTM